MTTKTKSLKYLAVSLIALFIACIVTVSAAAQNKQLAKAQTSFATPELAATALIEAAKNYDIDSLRSILGPGSEDLISSEDQIWDKSRAKEFADQAIIKNSIDFAKNTNRATLLVGPGDWPLPIPIVKRNRMWYFDTQQGRAEILARRIGTNELDAIAICRGFVDAQEEYVKTVHDNSGINQYAKRIISSPGKQDGLYWKNPDGTGGGPIAEAIARALEEGYTKQNDKPTPFHGYYFKILTGRGLAAPSGEVDFEIDGLMIGGFALAATPAQYGVTGIKSFIVSYEGTVYQKDLGSEGLTKFEQMERYNPDKTWTKTDDHWPLEAIASSTE